MWLELQATLIGRVALGAFLGYVIGFEREYRGKAAGERTFGLLSLGAAAVTAIGVLYFPLSAEKAIAGVVTGVGFLGAGLIFRERQGGQGQVLGLTTAASSWAAAAIGILAGAGVYLAAVVTTVIVLVILEVNRLPIYRRLDPSKMRRDEASGGYDPRFGTTAHPAARDDAPGED
ncbi:MAG TPA: MgtC/SapB family protein [Actinomycetota bacterium]